MEDKSQKYQQNSKSILIVEDERFITELYTRALENAGYFVSSVYDGEQALKEINSNSYDIVLLDIMLPSLSGIEILKKLKENSATINTKIVITTNLDQKDEQKEAIESLADGYLIKAEVTPKELLAYINELQDL